MVHGWAVPRQVLQVSALVTLVLLVAFVVALRLGGVPAAIGVGMGFVALTRPTLSLPPTRAAAFAVPAAMTGAVAVALRGQPLASAFFVALVCLTVAPAGELHEALMVGLATAVAMLSSAPGTFDPLTTAAWMLVGGLTLLGLALALKLPPAEAKPIPPPLVWRHAVVMAASVGVVVYLVQVLQIPHGYWMAATLTVVLRPVLGETTRAVRERVIGTVAGALLALVLADALPRWAVVAALGACTLLMIAYTTLGEQAKQVVFLTPTAILMAPAGSTRLFAVSYTHLTLPTSDLV